MFLLPPPFFAILLSGDVKCVSQIERGEKLEREKKHITNMAGKGSEHSSKQCDMQGSRLDLGRKWMAGRQVHS